MTLTAILPTLRSTLPDPMRTDSWPASARPTTTDVLLGGRSLWAESTTVPLPHLLRCDERSVMLARVFARVETFDDRVDLVLRCPDDLDYDWAEARLLGRVSVAPAVGVRLSSSERWQSARCALPRDVMLGDVVAVPVVER